MNYKIIVIDNKSINNSVEELKKQKAIILLEITANKGVSSENNIGIRYVLENFERRNKYRRCITICYKMEYKK